MATALPSPRGRADSCWWASCSRTSLRSATRWTAGGGVSLLQRALLERCWCRSSAASRRRSAAASSSGAAGRSTARPTRENRRLHAELRALETELQQRTFRAQEAERLRELLGLRQALPLDTLAAEVVGARRRALVPHADARQGRAGRRPARRRGDQLHRRRRPRVRGRPARGARADPARPRQRRRRAGRAQPRERRRLRPGLGPGGRQRGPDAQVRFRARRTWRSATSC